MTPAPERTCDVCEVPFSPTSYQQRRHPECRKAHNAARTRAARAADPETFRARQRKGPWTGTRECRYCGDTFAATTPRAAMCAAAECRRRFDRERMWGFLAAYERRHGHPYRWKRDPVKRKAYAEARRALQRGATEAEPVVRAVVFERDAWTCGLCGDPIDPVRAFPDRWSASLDHVVPLSKGGAHTLDNLQAAHLTCNASKGDRAPRFDHWETVRPKAPAGEIAD